MNDFFAIRPAADRPLDFFHGTLEYDADRIAKQSRRWLTPRIDPQLDICRRERGLTMSVTLGKTPREWPPAVREFVEGEQADAYSRLGRELGLGSDPAAAFARLNPCMPTADQIAPRRFKDAMGAGFLSEEQWNQFDAAVAQQYPDHAELQPPTAYESPVTYSILNMTYMGLGSAWSSSPRQEVYLASLPSGSPDARVVIERTTKAPVIFFEQGLMRFLYDFGMLVAWATPPLSPAQLSDDATLAKLPRSYTMPYDASGYFAGSLVAYVVDGTPITNASPIPRPNHNMFLAATLVTLMERFVMAHELAHITLGHLAIPADVSQEFAADARGLVTMDARARADGISWAMSYWACDLALTCLDILDHAIGVLAFPDSKLAWVSATHPSASSRRQHLRDTLAQLLPDAPPAGLLAASELCGMSTAVTARLLEFGFVSLAVAIQKGDRPSPLWNDRINYCFRPA